MEEDYDNDFDRLNNDPELTEEKLKEEMSNYVKALEEEFRLKSESEPENVEAYTNEFFRKNAHYAAAQIAWLSLNAESESVKLTASKLIIEKALKVESDEKDPIKDIIAGLKANDKKKQPQGKED